MDSVNHFEYLVLFSLIEKIHRNTPLYVTSNTSGEQYNIEKRQKLIIDNAQHIGQHSAFYSIFTPQNEEVADVQSETYKTLLNETTNYQFSALTHFWADKIFTEQSILEAATDPTPIDFITEFSLLQQKQTQLIERYQDSISLPQISFAHLKDIFEHVQDMSKDEQDRLFEWAQKPFYKRFRKPKEVKLFKKMILQENMFAQNFNQNFLILLKNLDQIYDKLFYLEKDVAFLETQFHHLCSQYRINRSRKFLEKKTTTTHDENMHLLEHISAMADEGENTAEHLSISNQKMWNAINGWAFFNFYSDNHQWDGWKKALKRIAQLDATDIPSNIIDEYRHVQSLMENYQTSD